MSFRDDLRNLIGFSFKPDTKKEQEEDNKLSAVEKIFDDGAYPVGNAYRGTLSPDQEISNLFQLITRYRELSLQPEFEKAIDDIVNEAIVVDDKTFPVKLNLDGVPNLSENLREKIIKEFEEVLHMLNFGTEAHEIFRRWYVDGRLFYYKVIDRTDSKKGIVELRYVDPRKMLKVREDVTNESDNSILAQINRKYEEYFIYNQEAMFQSVEAASNGIRIPKDTVTYIPSGLNDKSGSQVISYLHKAIRPFQQLRMAEDSMLVYRLARASEKRVFYIGTGKMSRIKAEEYVNSLMNRFRTRVNYDVSTGEIRSDRRFLSVLDDFWIPVPEGVQETKIDTLEAGGNLGETGDIEYYQDKLYESLGIPVSRLKNDTTFSLGRSGEILRDEVKFAKFISKLRRKFSELFDDLLRTQLLLKNILNDDEYETLRKYMYFDYLQDNAYEELKHLEIMNSRLDLLDRVEAYSQKYFSQKWIRNNVLYQSDDEIAEMDKEIEYERLAGKHDAQTDDPMGGPSFDELGLGPGGMPTTDGELGADLNIDEPMGDSEFEEPTTGPTPPQTPTGPQGQQ